jgi:hypothetical protein
VHDLNVRPCPLVLFGEGFELGFELVQASQYSVFVHLLPHSRISPPIRILFYELEVSVGAVFETQSHPASSRDKVEAVPSIIQQHGETGYPYFDEPFRLHRLLHSL